MCQPRAYILLLPFLLPTAVHGQSVDYVREIKPILASSCYACHGAIKQKGGLRLDTVAFMKEGGDHGSILSQGNASLILKHLSGEKGFKRMPPEGEGEPLKPAQMATIRRWIEQGAAAPKDDRPEVDPREHWAFRPPVRPQVPNGQRKLTGESSPNPIDLFIGAEREKRGLISQRPAEHGVWLRRVYIDLTGLPPTREEMQAFLKECEGAKPQAAYAKVVDRLLASPQYGERWGRHWMDIWRYSDWWGLGAELRNSQRHIWHWRDWIVEALNKDKGYDQMLREMLAADELYPTDSDALRGTGFLARHYFLFNRTTWLDETIEHTSKAFLGLTLNCCKCHDHKYDAFTHADYYRFRAIFEPYQIRTDLVPGETDVAKNGIPRVYDANLDAQTFVHLRGNEAAPDKQRKIVPNLPALLLPGGLRVQPIKLPPVSSQPGLRPFVLEDQLRVAEKQLAEARAELETAKTRLAFAPKLPKQNPTTATQKEITRDDFGTLDKTRWTIQSGEWAITDGKLSQKTIGNFRAALRLRQPPPADFEARIKFATLGGNTYRSVGISFGVDKDHETLIYLTPHPPARVQVSFKKDGVHQYPQDGAQHHKVILNQTNEIKLRVRGTLLNISVNGQPPLVYRLPIERRPGNVELITYDASARFEDFALLTLPPEVAMVESPGRSSTVLTEAQAKNALKIAEKKIAHAEAMINALKARAAADRARAAHPDSDATSKLAHAAAAAEKVQAVALAEWNLARAEFGDAALKMNPKQAQAALEAARKAMEKPGEVYTPLIGSVKSRENNLESDANRMKPFPSTSTGRRAAFARWLTDRENPLAARVAVNHIWARHFGQPLVASVFDFGRKGAAPTHPELLDWLAVELMDNQWSMKHLHRLLVLSNTYGMTTSSLGAAANNQKDDPDNKWYWRMNFTRMESQVVRDSLLHLAGELDPKMGGPSIDSPQQESSKRRSLYFFHSAIERNRFLMTFDEADPLDCYRRRDSITPLHALALSNSKFSTNMAQRIAARLEKSVAPQDFPREAFHWLLGYAPTTKELDICESALKAWTELNKKRPDAPQRARAQLIQALLNHNDFITVR